MGEYWSDVGVYGEDVEKCKKIWGDRGLLGAYGEGSGEDIGRGCGGEQGGTHAWVCTMRAHSAGGLTIEDWHDAKSRIALVFGLDVEVEYDRIQGQQADDRR